MNINKLSFALQHLIPLAHPYNDYYHNVQLASCDGVLSVAVTDRARLVLYRIGQYEGNDFRIDIHIPDAQRLLALLKSQPHVSIAGQTVQVGNTVFVGPEIGAYNLAQVAPLCLPHPSEPYPVTIPNVPKTKRLKYEGHALVPTEIMQFNTKDGHLMLGQYDCGTFPLRFSALICPRYISDLYKLLRGKLPVMFSFYDDALRFEQGDLTYMVAGAVNPKGLPIREI